MYEERAFNKVSLGYGVLFCSVLFSGSLVDRCIHGSKHEEFQQGRNVPESIRFKNMHIMGCGLHFDDSTTTTTTGERYICRRNFTMGSHHGKQSMTTLKRTLHSSGNSTLQQRDMKDAAPFRWRGTVAGPFRRRGGMKKEGGKTVPNRQVVQFFLLLLILRGGAWSRKQPEAPGLCQVVAAGSLAPMYLPRYQSGQVHVSYHATEDKQAGHTMRCIDHVGHHADRYTF